jgi:hypothetical protein
MKLVLQEPDILAGIKLFVQSQGILLANKTVEAAFTASRKGAGLSVELVIEDVVKPSAQETPVQAAAVTSEEATAKELDVQEPEQEPVAAQELPEAVVTALVPEAANEVPQAKSLFG